MACITGFTSGGYYEYIDCCGYNINGFAREPLSVCVDTTYSATSIGLILDTSSSCSQTCSLGPLSYTFSVTGACDTGSGTTIITGIGGYPPYTVDNVLPGGISPQTSSDPLVFTGLSAGTYVFRINDFYGYQNNEIYINIRISDCFYSNIYNVSGTTCGLENGTLTVSATSTSAPYNIVLYQDNVFYDYYQTSNLPYSINNLPVGIYNAIVYDYGITTASTENIVIEESEGIDFGFWKVNTSNCVIDKGKLSVTGVTGVGPFTYLWSTNETTQTITGLTAGSYSCTVTDYNGCSLTKSETISSSAPLGLELLTTVNPSCFSADGILTFSISGGSTPLHYSADTGEVGYTFSNTFAVSDLTSGYHNVLVRDSNGCELQTGGYLTPLNGFDVVGTTITNSNCNTSNGSISVQLQGSPIYYTYLVSGETTNTLQGLTTINQNYSVNNLPNDNYLLVISGNGTDCVYSSSFAINSTEKFSVSASTTGATCWQQNGSVYVEVGQGYEGVLDYILTDGLGYNQSISNVNLTAFTFNNLNSGTYTLEVRDEQNCSVFENVIITSSGNLLTSVNVTDCNNGDDGVAQVVIFNGNPPFIYEWSNNVCCSQTGNTVTGLTAGTYSVIVTDSSGCEQENKFEIFCNNKIITNYSLFNICEDTFNTTVGVKRGFLEMVGEGYLDITSGYSGCSLISTEFVCDLEISGVTYSQSFYTGYTNSDVPTDSLWKTTIENILDTIPEVSEYNIDVINNIFQVTSTCNGDVDPLANQDLKLYLTINYDVNCQTEISCIPTPTPTPAPCVDCGMSGYTFEINQT
jgi:hypothetical protein